MKQALLCKALSLAEFPVLMTDRDGILLDKNPAAERLLLPLRRGCDLSRRLVGTPLFEGGASAVLREGTPYRRAVILENGERYLLLFLSRLQFPDGEEAARHIADITGGRLPAQLGLWEPFEGQSAPQKLRLCRELLRIGTENTPQIDESFPFDRLWNRLASQLGGAFRSLGYRLSMERAEPFPTGRFIKLTPCGFTYLFSRLLFLIMKHSSNGILRIQTAWDAERETRMLRLSTRTALSEKQASAKDSEALFRRLASDTGIELFLLPEASTLLGDARLFVDSYGKLVIEYRLPSSDAPSSLILRSVDETERVLRRAAKPVLLFLREMQKRK